MFLSDACVCSVTEGALPLPHFFVLDDNSEEMKLRDIEYAVNVHLVHCLCCTQGHTGQSLFQSSLGEGGSHHEDPQAAQLTESHSGVSPLAHFVEL